MAVLQRYTYVAFTTKLLSFGDFTATTKKPFGLCAELGVTGEVDEWVDDVVEDEDAQKELVDHGLGPVQPVQEALIADRSQHEGHVGQERDGEGDGDGQ